MDAFLLGHGVCILKQIVQGTKKKNKTKQNKNKNKTKTLLEF